MSSVYTLDVVPAVFCRKEKKLVHTNECWLRGTERCLYEDGELHADKVGGHVFCRFEDLTAKEVPFNMGDANNQEEE